MASLSLLVGGSLALLGFLQNRQYQKTRFTITLLSQRITNERLNTGRFVLLKAAENGPLDINALPEDQYLNILSMLNFLEFLAISYRNGYLDRKVVFDTAGYSIVLTYESAVAFIEHRKQKTGQPIAFRNLEKLYAEFKARTDRGD